MNMLNNILIALLISIFIQFSAAQVRASDSSAAYKNICQTIMEERVDNITAIRVCECRVSNLSNVEIDPLLYEALIRRSGTSPLNAQRIHARDVVAPCQYYVFQSGILDNCTQSAAFASYRNTSPHFCLCDAFE